MVLKTMDIDITSLTVKNYNEILPSGSISMVINRLEENNYQCILVIDRKKHVLGILTLEKILRTSNLLSSAKKSMIDIPRLRKPSLDLLTQIYINKHIDLIPIVNKNEKLEYVISVFQLAKKMVSGLDFEKDVIIDEDYSSLEINETQDRALAIIRKNYSDFIPITNEGKLSGIVHAKQLLSLLLEIDRETRGEKKGEKQKYVGSLEKMVQDPSESVVISQDFFSADQLINQMSKNNIQSLLVVDEENSIIGLITLRKILKLTVEENLENIYDYPIRVLSAPDSNIESIAKKKISGLLERHHNFFGEKLEPQGAVRFRKIENQSQRGMFMYDTEIRVSFGKGKDSNFSVDSSDWGAEKSLNKTFNKLSRLISDKRKIARDHSRVSLRTLDQ
ncbi:MAG: CBS domain-containing protein [Candidatus Hodarchaeales archaeon]|jgi:CBS domain-containing protein